MDERKKRNVETVGMLSYLSKFIHVASVGMTARATGNSIAESFYPRSTALSYGSYALFMNMAANNQVTHNLLSYCKRPGKNRMIDNLSLTLTLP